MSPSEIVNRQKIILEAWNLAARKQYFQAAIAAHVAEEFLQFIVGMIGGILAAAVIIAVGNIGGALVGSAIAVLTDGAGAITIPVCRQIGHMVAMAVLAVLGLKFIIEYVGDHIHLVGQCFAKAVDCAWDSWCYDDEPYKARMEYSALYFGEGIGLLMALVVIGLLTLLSMRRGGNVAKWQEALNSKFLSTVPKLEAWLIHNTDRLQEKFRNGPLLATITARLPATPEEYIKGMQRSALAAKLLRPFDGFADFSGRRVAELRSYLQQNGFKKLADMRSPGEKGPNGEVYKDFQSEIWVRSRKGCTQLECVRIDPVGHVPPARGREGPIRLKPGGGSERIAWGERPHYHLESIAPSNLEFYLNTYEPQAVKYGANTQSIAALKAEMAQTKAYLEGIFGKGSMATPVSEWQVMHIPLSGP